MVKSIVLTCHLHCKESLPLHSSLMTPHPLDNRYTHYAPDIVKDATAIATMLPTSDPIPSLFYLAIYNLVPSPKLQEKLFPLPILMLSIPHNIIMK